MIGRSAAGLVGFLALWEVAGRSGVVKAGVLPPASVVLVRFLALFTDREFITEAASTMVSWPIALGLASVIAIPLGMVLGRFRPLRLSMGPVLEFLRPLPTVALIPLVTLVLGGGAQTKIALAVFASVWPILFNTMYAVGEIDRQLLETARAFRVGPVRLASGVILPAVAPFALTGIRLSAAVALIVLVSTEYFTSSVGIGHFVSHWGTTSLRMDLVLASVVFVGLAGYLVNTGLLSVQRRWMGWAATGGAI